MTTTVVGLFKSVDEAQNVKHDLVTAGYAASTIQVVDDGKSTGASSSEPGFMTSIGNFFKSMTGDHTGDEQYYSEGMRNGGGVIMVTVEEARADAVAAFLEQRGATNVDEQLPTEGIQTASATATATAGETYIPIVEEELKVGKREVRRGGVRVYSYVTEKPVEESIRLRQEHVTVDRHAVNRPATDADFQTFKSGTVELVETAEEAVVSKTARVVEEVVVGKETTNRTETVKDSVRRTSVEVEEIEADRKPR